MLAETAFRFETQHNPTWGSNPQHNEVSASTVLIKKVVTPGTRLGLPELEVYLYKQAHPSMSSGLTSQIEEIQKRIKAQNIRIPNSTDVRDCFLNKTEVLGIIENICALTAEKFAGRAQISLELYKDPEIDWNQLTLFVRMKNYSAQIMDEIDQLRDRFDLLYSNISDWLLVTTDFQQPK